MVRARRRIARLGGFLEVFARLEARRRDLPDRHRATCGGHALGEVPPVLGHGAIVGVPRDLRRALAVEMLDKVLEAVHAVVQVFSVHDFHGILDCHR